MREAGRCMAERDGFKLYECFIGATFSKARQGGDGSGAIKLGHGVKIMLVVDAAGLPAAAYAASATPPHESLLVQGLFDFMATATPPERIVGDKAYDSDALDADLAERGGELIAPHRINRQKLSTQDGRPLRRFKRRWSVERLISWLQNFRGLCIRWEKSACLFQAMLHLRLLNSVAEGGVRIPLVWSNILRSMI